MYEDNIARGMVYLDKKCPGWTDRINLSELDLPNCNDCVLGQLGVSYGHFRRDHNLGETDARSYGFDMGSYVGCWATLTDEWKAAITERRNRLAEPITP
jgi:hypothetical protein